MKMVAAGVLTEHYSRISAIETDAFVEYVHNPNEHGQPIEEVSE